MLFRTRRPRRPRMVTRAGNTRCLPPTRCRAWRPAYAFHAHHAQTPHRDRCIGARSNHEHIFVTERRRCRAFARGDRRPQSRSANSWRRGATSAAAGCCRCPPPLAPLATTVARAADAEATAAAPGLLVLAHLPPRDSNHLALERCPYHTEF